MKKKKKNIACIKHVFLSEREGLSSSRSRLGLLLTVGAVKYFIDQTSDFSGLEACLLHAFPDAFSYTRFV